MKRAPRHRALIALSGAALTIGALGVWGLAADRGTGATLGSEIAHDGGVLTAVGAWTMDDPMMSMMGGDGGNADQFAESGMPMGQMSQMMSDGVPDGMKRVAVQLSLRAGTEDMAFPASDIRLEVADRRFPPYTTLLADEVLSPGTQLSGLVTFEIPIDTVMADFLIDGDAEPISLDVSKGPDGGAPMMHDMDGM